MFSSIVLLNTLCPSPWACHTYLISLDLREHGNQKLMHSGSITWNSHFQTKDFFLPCRSSAKTNLPSTSGTVQQTITSKSHNNSTASQNSQRRDAGDNDDQDDAMFNDDDDDLDITEIDQALLGDKTPLTAQKTNAKGSKMKDSSSSNTEKMSTTRRYGGNFVI